MGRAVAQRLAEQHDLVDLLPREREPGGQVRVQAGLDRQIDRDVQQ
jgi:hypothetical protein